MELHIKTVESKSGVVGGAPHKDLRCARRLGQGRAHTKYGTKHQRMSSPTLASKSNLEPDIQHVEPNIKNLEPNPETKSLPTPGR